MGAIVEISSALVQKAGVKSEKNARLIVYGALSVVAIIAGVIVTKRLKTFLVEGMLMMPMILTRI